MDRGARSGSGVEVDPGRWVMLKERYMNGLMSSMLSMKEFCLVGLLRREFFHMLRYVNVYCSVFELTIDCSE